VSQAQTTDQLRFWRQAGKTACWSAFQNLGQTKVKHRYLSHRACPAGAGAHATSVLSAGHCIDAAGGGWFAEIWKNSRNIFVPGIIARQGCPRTRLWLAFYGRGWAGVARTNDGLYQKPTKPPPKGPLRSQVLSLFLQQVF
jgi:hypothetical protein